MQSAKRSTVLLLTLLLWLLAGCMTPDGSVVWIEAGEDGMLRAAPLEATSTATEPSPAEALIEEGAALADAGNIEGALALFEEAAAADPTNPLVLYFLALAQFELGDSEAALANLDKVLALDPTLFQGFRQRAHIRYQGGDYAGAIADLTAAIDLAQGLSEDRESTLADLFAWRAAAYKAVGNLANQLADLEQHLIFNPLSFAAYDEVRESTHAAAIYTERIADYEADLDADAGSPQALYARGMAHLILGQQINSTADLDAAIEEFSAAIDGDFTFAAAYHKRALAWLSRAAAQKAQLEVRTMHLEGDEGTVEVFDRKSGQNLTLTRDEYTEWLDSVEQAEREAQTQARADLEDSLALSEQDAVVIYDLAVLRYAQSIQDNEFDVAGAEEAIEMLGEAAKLATDWRQPRFSRSIALLIAGLLNMEQGDPTPLLQAAADEAEALLVEEPDNGWLYAVHGLALVFRARAAGEEPDAEVEAKIQADFEHNVELLPNVNPDDLMAALIAQVQYSEHSSEPAPFMSGRLEFGYEGRIYVNEEFGFRLPLPNQKVGWRTTDGLTSGSALAIHIDDDFQVFDVVAIPAELGGQSIIDWVEIHAMSWLEGARLAPDPVSTPYGEAAYIEFADQAGNVRDVALIAPIGDSIFVFRHTLGEYAGLSDLSDSAPPSPQVDTVLALMVGLEFADPTILRDSTFVIGSRERGVALWREGDYPLALAELNAAIEREPENTNYYNNRALIYISLGDYQSSLDDMQRMIELAGELEDFQLDTRAYAYLKMGSYAKANADYETLLENGFDSPVTLLGAGITWAMLGEMEKAMPLLEEGLRAVEVEQSDDMDPQYIDLIDWARQIVESASVAPEDTPEAQKPSIAFAATVYTNPDFPWSVAYPAGWSVDDSDTSYIRINRSDDDGLFGLCGIHSAAVDFTTVDEFVDVSLPHDEEYFKDRGQTFGVLSRQDITLSSGVSGVETIAEIGPGGKSRRVYMLADGRAYAIDCETYLADWPKLESVYNQIINSFTLETSR
jgi:tetratricopeptide (TPR) repeat protein